MKITIDTDNKTIEIRVATKDEYEIKEINSKVPIKHIVKISGAELNTNSTTRFVSQFKRFIYNVEYQKILKVCKEFNKTIDDIIEMECILGFRAPYHLEENNNFQNIEKHNSVDGYELHFKFK